MLIAIISDIHDNLYNLEKCLSWCQKEKIKTIICCGDVTNLETINFLANTFFGEIFLVEGNGKLYKKEALKSLPNINYFGSIGTIKIDSIKIGFCHEKYKIKKLTKQDAFDFIFYGHSHKPWIEKENKTIISNPGNIAGIYYPATFSTLNTKNKILNLKLVDKLQ